MVLPKADGVLTHFRSSSGSSSNNINNHPFTTTTYLLRIFLLLPLLGPSLIPASGAHGSIPAVASAAVLPDQRSLTISFSAMNSGPAAPPKYWMFDNDTLWWTQKPQGTSIYAPELISWAYDDAGDTTCHSGGTGMASYANCSAATSNLPALSSDALPHIYPKIDGLALDTFAHINTIDPEGDWHTPGAAGDSRKYVNGSLDIHHASCNGSVLFRIRDLVFQNRVNYMGPVGDAPTNQFLYGGYLLGTIDIAASHPDWISEFDPDASGIFFASLDAVVMSAPRFSCYTPISYTFSIRAGDVDGVTSDAASIVSAEDAALLARSRDKNATILGAIAAIAVAVVAIAAAAMAAAGAIASAAFIATPIVMAAVSPGGAGVSTMLNTATWVAAFAQINGGKEFSTPFVSFAAALDPFILRMDPPWSSALALESLSGSHRHPIHWPLAADRQDIDDETSPLVITAREFQGTVFWALLVVGVCALLHIIVACFVYKASRVAKIKAHAWMTYLTSIAIAYVFTGSVLGSIQYIRAASAAGNGHPGLYVLAAIIILVYGVGIFGFVCTVIYLARNQLSQGQLDWVPKNLSSDPEVRKSKISQGEYQTEEDNIVHGVFACYYDGLRGPVVWVAWLDQVFLVAGILVITTVSSHISAVILLLIVSVIFLGVIVVANPFVDKIESAFQTIIALLQTMVCGLAVASASSGLETSEMLDMVLLTLEFVALAVAILLAVYVDLLTILSGLIQLLRRKFGAGNSGAASHNPLSDISEDNGHVPTSAELGEVVAEESDQLPP